MISLYSTEHYISTYDCKKVVIDILGKTEFFENFERTGKMTLLSHNAGVNSKFLNLYGRNKMLKNNEIQRRSPHKFSFPSKWLKSTYDLLAFNRRYVGYFC